MSPGNICQGLAAGGYFSWSKLNNHDNLWKIDAVMVSIAASQTKGRQAGCAWRFCPSWCSCDEVMIPFQDVKLATDISILPRFY